MDPVTISIETGKLAFIPSRKPVDGPMGEYCLHLRPPKGEHSVWAKTTGGEPSGEVESIYVSFDGEKPIEQAQCVGFIVCDAAWLIVGDLTFAHERDPRGTPKSNSEYNRGMSAVRRGKELGGEYRLDSGDTALAFRVGLKEAMLPVRIRFAQGGRLSHLVIDLMDGVIDLGDEEAE